MVVVESVACTSACGLPYMAMLANLGCESNTTPQLNIGCFIIEHAVCHVSVMRAIVTIAVLMDVLHMNLG